jgi:hypothetical protein
MTFGLDNRHCLALLRDRLGRLPKRATKGNVAPVNASSL